MTACRNGQTVVAALWLERGADINAKGVFGGTGLHWAAINGHKDTVEFLVAHGADLTIRDTKFGSTQEGGQVRASKTRFANCSMAL